MRLPCGLHGYTSSTAPDNQWGSGFDPEDRDLDRTSNSIITLGDCGASTRVANRYNDRYHYYHSLFC
jgi:hypothetical protein